MPPGALGWIGLFWSDDGLAQSYVRNGVRVDEALAGVNAALWVLNRFGAFLPTGRGLFSFTTIDDVLAAVDAIEGDYAGHSRAAYDIAEECFAAEKVVGSLMTRAGL